MAVASDPFGHADQRYATILALAVDAIICIDDRQRIVLFNAGAETSFGYTAAEILGQSIERLIPSRFRDNHARHVDGFAAGPPAARHMSERKAIYALRKSGEEFPAEATISKIAFEGGHLLTVVLRDVTERVKAEAIHRQDTEKLQQALFAGRLGGFEQDFLTGQVRLFGDAPAILALDKAECQRDELLTLVHEEDRAALQQASHHLADSGRFDLEYRIRKPDGTIAWIRHIGTIVNDDRQSPQVFGTVQDISHQKDIEHELERRIAERTAALTVEVRQREETQKQLVQSQRMEAFGQLTGGIAHDFNNLLTVIGGNLELLEQQVSGERPQRQLKRALDAVGMGARLTQRLLTFARRSNLEPEVLNLNDQVINLIDLLRRTIGESVTISSVLAPDLGRVRADASEVENAILNLAINARDAMPAGGKLVIETANAEVGKIAPVLANEDSIAPGRYVRLSVTDTGTGMAPEVLARAFEPFFTTKEHGRGTGLGLATIYGFARQSGGGATIHSVVGEGTVVSLFLPRSDQPVAASEAASAVMPAVTAKRILVAEDNPDVMEVTLQRLERLGYDHVACESGPAAVQILQGDQHIDLVFSDIMMAGGMSGFDLAAWIRTHRPGLKVLLTSGFSHERTGTTARQTDDLKILRKPYAADDLARALLEAFEAN